MFLLFVSSSFKSIASWRCLVFVGLAIPMSCSFVELIVVVEMKGWRVKINKQTWLTRVRAKRRPSAFKLVHCWLSEPMEVSTYTGYIAHRPSISFLSSVDQTKWTRNKQTNKETRVHPNHPCPLPLLSTVVVVVKHVQETKRGQGGRTQSNRRTMYPIRGIFRLYCMHH